MSESDLNLNLEEMSANDLYKLGVKTLSSSKKASVLEKGFNIFKKAAEKGSLEAILGMSNCYLKGLGVPINNKLAFEYCQKAAEKGFGAAMHNLGSAYFQGIMGLKRDEKKAIFWFEKAVDSMDIPSMMILAQIYTFSPENSKIDRAIFLLETCAESGNASAMMNLGQMYAHGKGVSINLEKAAQWWDKAAMHGDVRGLFQLAGCYVLGRGVKADPSTGYRLLKRAADAGYDEAIEHLSMLGWDNEDNFTAKNINTEDQETTAFAATLKDLSKFAVPKKDKKPINFDLNND